MSLTTDPSDPGLTVTKPNGQNAAYLILSDEERAKGFVRPVRVRYQHVGIRPTYPTRPLTAEEQERHKGLGYVCYEEYPPERSPVAGRYWTNADLTGGCQAVTMMADPLAETYARDPKFYGATYCSGCRKHLPVGEDGEFVWYPDGPRVGT